MNTNSDGSSNAGKDGPWLLRRFRTDMRTLIVLVACCAVTLWALRRLWENYDPVLVETRSIQNRAIGTLQTGKPAERVTAIHMLERLGTGDSRSHFPR